MLNWKLSGKKVDKRACKGNTYGNGSYCFAADTKFTYFSIHGWVTE